MTESLTTTPTQAERPSRWWFVHVSIITAFFLFFAFVSILYWHWLQTPEPSSIIKVVPGNPELAGTIIRIEGAGLGRPIEVELNEENNFGTRIFLVPGDYRMQIVNPDGVVAERHDFAMGPYYERTVNLTPRGP